VEHVEAGGWSQPFWQPVPQKSTVVPQLPNSLQQTLRGHFSLPGAASLPHAEKVVVFVARRERKWLLWLARWW
jgi:hypothetical protein